MKRVFIIHGWNSSPRRGWKPWLKKKLEAKRFEVEAPQMPNPLRPKADEWVSTIKETVGTPDKDCFFVGHSLGCAAILLYLETIETRIGGAVLVAGPSSSQKKSPFINSFFKKGFKWARIKKNCKRFIIMHSDNDRVVPIKHGYFLKKKLGAKMVVEKKGHYIGSRGVVCLPSAFDAILEMAE